MSMMMITTLTVTALLIATYYLYPRSPSKEERERLLGSYLIGKVVWITGASSGLGRSLALLCSKHGARVILSARNAKALEEVKHACEEQWRQRQGERDQRAKHGQSAETQEQQRSSEVAAVLPLDVGTLHQSMPQGGLDKQVEGNEGVEAAQAAEEDPTEAESRAAQAQSLFGGIDILINNAGISTRASAEQTKGKVEQTLMSVNFFGQVALAKAALKYLRERSSHRECSTKGTRTSESCGALASIRDRGHIVVVNSVQGKLGIPFRSSYAASKHALTGYFDSLRAELDAEDEDEVHRNVKVTAIFPGYIRTNLSKNALTGSGAKYGKTDDTTAGGMDPDDLAANILQDMVLGKGERVYAELKVKVAIFLRPLLPELYFKMLVKRAKANSS